MNELVVNGFDYSLVDQDCRDDVRDAAVRIKVRMARTAADIIDIGKDLIAAKEAVGHGNFLAWIDAEFGMSERTARNFMAVAHKLGAKSASLADFGKEALYALAAPTMPEEVVGEVIERSTNGEKFTAADIKALKDDWEAEKRGLKDKLEAAREKAIEASSIKDDFKRQVVELQTKLDQVRDEADTFRHEVERRQGSATSAAQRQVDAIMREWNKACPEARERFLEAVDQPVFDRTRAA